MIHDTLVLLKHVKTILPLEERIALSARSERSTKYMYYAINCSY